MNWWQDKPKQKNISQMEGFLFMHTYSMLQGWNMQLNSDMWDENLDNSLSTFQLLVRWIRKLILR